MLAKTKLAKLEKQLDEVNARTRNLTIEGCEGAIEKAEEAVKKLSPEFRTLVSFEYNPHEVAKSYGYRAEGTAITVRFNKQGKAVEATAHRDTVTNYTKRRLTVTWAAVNDLAVMMNDGNPVSEAIIKLLLKSNGFNTTHLVKQV